MSPPEAARPPAGAWTEGWRDAAALQVAAIAAATLLVRLLYLATPAGRVGTADEAVFGMMAERIMALEEFPIYCWGAHYAGAPVSYVAALIFRLVGPGFVALRMAMVPVAVATIATWYVIYRRILGESGALLGTAMLLFCPVVVLHHTMGAYGGYGESFLGIALIIVVAMAIERAPEAPPRSRLIILLGAISGFFFYVMFLVVPAIIAFALPPLWRSRRRLRSFALFAAAFVAGASPMIIYNVQNAAATLLRAAGRSTGVGGDALDRSAAEVLRGIIVDKVGYLGSWLLSAPSLLGDYVLPARLGDAPRYVAGLLLAAALIGFTAQAYRHRPSDVTAPYARRFAAFLVLLLLFQWFAGLTRSRHLLPLLPALPVVLYPLLVRIDRRRALLVFGALYCGLQLAGWYGALGRAEFDGAPAAAALRRLDIGAFYGSYWSTYPILFADRGDLLGAPHLLPFNTPLTDRTPEISTGVFAASSPAFVFRTNEAALEQRFEAFLTREQLDYRVAEGGGVRIFFDLSRRVTPVVERRWETGFALR